MQVGGISSCRMITIVLTLYQQLRASPSLQFQCLVISAQFLVYPANSRPSLMLWVWSPLSLCGPPAIAFGKLGCIVHGFPPLDSFQRNCTPTDQIDVRHFTKPDLYLLSRACSWVGSIATLFQRRAQAHNLRISS